MPKILIIETDVLLAKNIKRALVRAGHSVKLSRDPQAAIVSADKNTPDLVILDLFLARRSGIEFLHEFRSYPEWASVPTVVLSSVPEAELEPFVNHLDQLDIKKFLYKPTFSLAQLSAVVAQLTSTVPA